MTILTDALRAEYQKLFDGMVLRPERANQIALAVAAITTGHSAYDEVGTRLAIPWEFIGIIHSMESDCNFRTHLHNGDPLTDRTVHVPKGRPTFGDPPFTWQDSAEDALRMRGLDRWKDWSTTGMLFQFEAYNGWGYRKHGVPSPYLWAGSTTYNRGKFVSDGVFDPKAVSKQIGAAVLLKQIGENG